MVLHTISIELTLVLSVWRYIMITIPLRCKTLCSMERAKWLVASAYLISPLLCPHIYFTFSISAIAPPAAGANSVNSSSSNTTADNNVGDLMELGIGNASQVLLLEEDDVSINMTATTPTYPLLENNNISSATAELSTQPEKYVVNLSTLTKQYPLLMTANFWFYSVVLKLLPCVMLTIVSFRLINSLLEAKRRKEKLFGVRIVGGLPVVSGVRINSAVAGVGVNTALAAPTPPPIEDADSNGGGSRSGSFTRSTWEICVTTLTTRMLLAVLLLFLITEFPQGILALLSDLLGDKFFKECYYPLSDLMDFVALLNSAINFILYCSMSTRFRDVFCQVFHLTPLLDFCERHHCRRRRRP